MPYRDKEKQKEYHKEYRRKYKDALYEKAKIYKENNREKVQTYNKKWNIDRLDKDPRAVLPTRARSNAKDKNLECTISKEDFILPLPTHCPILGIPIQFNKDERKENSISIDRVDNSKGYVPGNIAIISSKANSNKGNLSIEDIKRLYSYVLQHTN